MISEMEALMSPAEWRLSSHAALRMPQRSFRDGYVELIAAYGTEVEGGYLMRRKDILEIEHPPKEARRLIGKRLVVKGGVVVTGYHARRGKEHKLLRRL